MSSSFDYKSLNRQAKNKDMKVAVNGSLPVPANDNIPLVPVAPDGGERGRRLRALKRMMIGMRLVT